MKKLYLYLSDVYLGELMVDNVRGRETYMFRYDADYLRADRPVLDPAIRNVTGPQYSLSDGIFGFLADVALDRWGRKLIRRREKRTLCESDFVLGVCDLTRQGALRIKEEKDGPFVALDLGDLIADAEYYRFTRSEADREYSRMKDIVARGQSGGKRKGGS